MPMIVLQTISKHEFTTKEQEMWTFYSGPSLIRAADEYNKLIKRHPYYSRYIDPEITTEVTNMIPNI